MINLKNFIKSEPSKTSPISLILQHKHDLETPFRPIEFIRKYPSVFEEFLPGGIGVNPHVRLTNEVMQLDGEEEMVFLSGGHKQDVADKLLKLLMVGKVNRIPLRVIDKLKWDLGLPNDYVESVVPEFPDYFCVRKCDGLGVLELVCWSDELAVSEMEKRAMSGKEGYSKGVPIAFPLQYSRGFEVDKKFKKWVDDWQKLPYVSPYESVLSCQGKGDEFDKWAVGVLHEILSLFVPKKTEKDNILLLGDYLGVRSRFKKALLQHPGIFYISSKLHTHTVVLRDAYKRDLLIGKPNPVMEMRSKYIHLMTAVKEESKSKSAQVGNTRRKKKSVDLKEGEEEDSKDDQNEEEEDENSNRLSDSEFEEESDDDDYEDESDDDESEHESTMNRGRASGKSSFEEKARALRTEQKQFDGRHPSKTGDRRSPTHSRGKEIPAKFERDESNRRHQSKTLDGQSPSYERGRQSPIRNERHESTGRRESNYRHERGESKRSYPDKAQDKRSSTFSGRREGPWRDESDRSARRQSPISNEREESNGRRESNFRNDSNESKRSYPDKSQDKRSSTFSGRRERPWRNEPDRSAKRYPRGTEDSQSPQSFRGQEASPTNSPNQSDRRHPSKARDEQSPTYTRGKETLKNQMARRKPHGRSDVSRTRKSTSPNKTPTF